MTSYNYVIRKKCDIELKMLQKNKQKPETN